MKWSGLIKKIVSVFFVIAVGFIAIGGFSGCAQKPEDKVIATVNGEKVYARDFIDFYTTRPRVAEWGSHDGKLDPGQVLNALIDKALMVHEGKALQLDKLPGFREEVEKFNEKVMVNVFIEKWFDPEVLITDEEVKNSIPEFMKKEVKFARICVLTEKEAREIKENLDQRGDFSRLAREKSIGIDAENGGIGDFLSPHRGIYPKGVIETIFNIPIGEVSAPQKIREGYGLFKPMEERPLNKEEMGQLMQYHRTLMMREKKSTLIKELLKEVKKEKKITIDTEAIREIASGKGKDAERYNPLLANGKGIKLSWKEIKETLTDFGHGKKQLWDDQNTLYTIVNSRVEQKLMVLEAKKKRFERDPEVKKETERFMQDLLVRQLTMNEIEKKLVVTDEECRKYYQENQMQFSEPEMVRVSHILLKDRDKAMKVLSQLRHGANFAEMARQYSEYKSSAGRGGDMGFIHHQESGMGESFEKQAFSIKEGEISGIISTPFGYQILSVTGRKEARVVPFEEVKDRIATEMTNQKREGQFKKYLEDIRKKADIRKDEKTFDEAVKTFLNTG